MTDFTEIHDRTGTKSMKWDQIQNIFQSNQVLPMWVADMDFKAPKEVNEAIQKRAQHGIYGYTVIDEPIKEKVKNWVQTQHQWNIQTDSLLFSPGVITTLHTAIQTFTDPGDKILIQTPVYTPFFSLIKDGGRELVENPLHYNGEKYAIDFADLEYKLKQGVKAFILCSPHNPVGRVWTKDELRKIAELCIKYDVLILSDEIHADIVFKDFTHTPIASLSEEIANQTITCLSPTKTFNLAGLQVSYVVITNPKLRLKMKKQFGLDGFNMLNTFGVTAIEAAYTHGLPWLEDLIDVLSENKQYAIKRLTEETNGKINVIDSEATYLLWLDCSKLSFDDTALHKFMIEDAKVGLNTGTSYGEQGKQFMRLNIACPKSTLEEGINRIVKAVQQLNS